MATAPNVPQFDTAQFNSAPGPARCTRCGQLIGNAYYRVDGLVACEQCALKARADLPNDSHSAYVRGLIFGIGAAIAGLILYSTFAITTGLVIGYLSLAVGFIVAKAIKAGSRGRGGRKYQITAVALTYAAVSLAAIPIAIAQASKDRPAQRQTASSSSQPASANAADGAETKSFGAAIATLLMIGIASPFLDFQDPVHGAIGLVILFVGIRIAWKMTAGSPVAPISGPFGNPATAPAASVSA
jgi:hypothetical protein